MNALIQVKEYMIDEFNNGAENTLDPSHYTREGFIKFAMLKNSMKRRNVEQLLTNQQLGGPLATSTHGRTQPGTKVTGEKRYESWTRGRRSKDSFNILNHDKTTSHGSQASKLN